MAVVTGFVWHVGDAIVRWTCGGIAITKTYAKPAGSAVPLGDGSGVAVVEPEVAGCRDNAVLFNSDGTERFRLTCPTERGLEVFWELRYVSNELTAIAVGRDSDWAYVIDEASGGVGRSYETR